MLLYSLINQYCTHSEREPEQFGSWSESYDNTFKRIQLSPPRVNSDSYEYHETICPDEVKAGDVVYVVWVEYDEGNSFGYADRKGLDVIAAFTDSKEAEALREYIWNQKYDRSEDRYLNEFITPNGKKITFYASWMGYFEHLSGAYVEAEVVGI